MKAVTYARFGGPDVLELTEVAAPPVRPGHLRVRVHAVSFNPLDAKIRRGALRLMSGASFPKTPGCDLAGVVESVGPGVVGFAVGDRVFGAPASMKSGTLAELAEVPARVMAKIPAGLDDVTAVAIAVVGLSASQSLTEIAGVKAGDRVLLHGATGGIGLHAIQMARGLGADVTAVCGPASVDVAREFGANEVIERGRSLAGRSFDAVLDLSTRLSFAGARPLLARRGVYVGFEPAPAAMLAAALLNPFRGHKHRFLIARASTDALVRLARRFESGELRPTPTRVFELAEFREAFATAERGGVVGKVVIRLA